MVNFPFRRNKPSLTGNIGDLLRLEREAIHTPIVGNDGELLKPDKSFESFSDKTRQDFPLFYFFDGKSIKGYSDNQKADFFSNYGLSAAMFRPTRLPQNDYGWAMAYTQSEYAFRAVEMVASDISAIPRYVRSKTTKQPLPDHPLMRALRWAKRVCYQDTISLWEKALYVFGENYLLPVGNGFRDPATGRAILNGLQWLNPLATEPYIMNGKLIEYWYNAVSQVVYKPDEILYDKVSSLTDDLRGQSRLSVALAAVNIDVEIKRYTLDSFLKDMRMSGILTGARGSNITQAQLDAALSVLKGKRDERLVALAPALVWQQVQHDWNDTQFAASEDARRRITTALGVPMSVVGAWDDAHYQSAPAQLEFYYDSVVFRECDRITAYMNDVVIPVFDPSGEGEWWWEKDAVLGLIEDKETKTNIANSQLAAGGITLNEYRQKVGEKTQPDGDVYYMPAGIVPIPQGSLIPNYPMAQLPVSVVPPALPAPTTGKDILKENSAIFMLTFPQHPDLVELQRRVKALAGETAVNWTDPAEFHLTLVYMPSITPEHRSALIAACADLEPPDLSLRLGSLGVFDSVGEYALHFKIRRNLDLLDFQQELVDLCEQMGIPLSAYSQPEAYKPHVTMGYASAKMKHVTVKQSLSIQPSAFLLASGDQGTHYIHPLKSHDGVLRFVRAEGTFREARDKELNAWFKHYKNKGAIKALDFVTYLVRADEARTIRDALNRGDFAGGDETNHPTIKAAFDELRAKYAVKAIEDTRSAFIDEIRVAIEDGVNKSASYEQTAGRIRGAIQRYGKFAYQDGLAEVGVDPSELDESDLLKIQDISVHDTQYVSNLVDQIYSDEGLKGTPDDRAAKWQGTIDEFYFAGIESGDQNAMFRFDGIITKTSCSTCRRLMGQVHRMKDWIRKQFIPHVDHDSFECGSFDNCSHQLVQVAGKSEGNW
jgi:2'-5' RNA ligase